MRWALAVGALLLSGCGDELRRESLPDDTQIVAQWPLSRDATPLDLQRYFAAEDLIGRECRQICSEDGNDVGGGVFNVFLYAADVDAAIALLIELDEADRLPEGVRIGVAVYTNEERTDWTYRPVYPAGLTTFSPFARGEDLDAPG